MIIIDILLFKNMGIFMREAGKVIKINHGKTDVFACPILHSNTSYIIENLEK